MANKPKRLTNKRKHEIELLIEAFDLVPSWVYPLSDTIISMFNQQLPREFPVEVIDDSVNGVLTVVDKVTAVVFARRKRVPRLGSRPKSEPEYYDHGQLTLF